MRSWNIVTVGTIHLENYRTRTPDLLTYWAERRVCASESAGLSWIDDDWIVQLNCSSSVHWDPLTSDAVLHQTQPENFLTEKLRTEELKRRVYSKTRTEGSNQRIQRQTRAEDSNGKLRQKTSKAKLKQRAPTVWTIRGDSKWGEQVWRIDCVTYRACQLQFVRNVCYQKSQVKLNWSKAIAFHA